MAAAFALVQKIEAKVTSRIVADCRNKCLKENCV